MWPTLLSGILGAVIGGAAALAASVITMKQQRQLALEQSKEEWRQDQLRASRSAGGRILSEMVTIKWGLWDVQDDLEAGRDPSLKAVYTAAENISVVHNSQIASKDLRSRVNELCKSLDTWYLNTRRPPSSAVNKKRIEALTPYMDYVSKSIQAHLDEQDPPSYQSPPDLLI